MSSSYKVVNRSIILSDYAERIMETPTNLRDAQFHNSIKISEPETKEQEIVPIHNATKKFMINPATFKKDNIELCIQNDDKLIGFLSSVKSRRGINAVILSTATQIIILIKSQDLHPVLVMVYPIDHVRVYASTSNLVFNLPIEEFIPKSGQPLSTSNGYALYYKREMDPESNHLLTTLHYKLQDGNSVVPIVRDVNMEFINLMLQPTSIIGTTVRRMTLNSDGLTNLMNISLIMLVNTQISSGFKENTRDKTTTLTITTNEQGVQQMNMIVHYRQSATTTKPIANEKNALIWRFQSVQSNKWEIYPSSILLLQNVNSKIKTSSDFLYTGFGRYGSEFVFMKLITTKAITDINFSAPVIQLSKLLEGYVYIFEIYFCHE